MQTQNASYCVSLTVESGKPVPLKKHLNCYLAHCVCCYRDSLAHGYFVPYLCSPSIHSILVSTVTVMKYDSYSTVYRKWQNKYKRLVIVKS